MNPTREELEKDLEQKRRAFHEERARRIREGKVTMEEWLRW